MSAATAAPASADEVNIYSYRQPFLIKPFLDEFTKETGIKVNVVFAKKGLIDRAKQESRLSPMDVLLTVDIGNLTRAGHVSGLIVYGFTESGFCKFEHLFLCFQGGANTPFDLQLSVDTRISNVLHGRGRDTRTERAIHRV